MLDTFSPTSLTLWETDEKIAPNPNTAAYTIFKTLNAAEASDALKNTRTLTVRNKVYKEIKKNRI